MPVPDLGPAAEEMSALIATVPDEMLGRSTPCPGYRLGDLIDHVGGLALAFTAAAAKDRGPLTGSAPSGDAARLSEDWRTRIPRNLSAMAAAWRDPAAWTGMTQAGGGDLPGEVAGLAGLDELVVHAWDIARASGQELASDPAAVESAQRWHPICIVIFITFRRTHSVSLPHIRPALTYHASCIAHLAHLAPEQEGFWTVSAHTSEAVIAAIDELRKADPAKRQLTLKEIAQALEPDQVAMVQAGQADGLLWEESLSNTLKQLGRDGKLAVALVPDDRGYEYPVVQF